ncbi:MAG: type II secretion system protein GspL [Alcanivoracaceae bacterium]
MAEPTLIWLDGGALSTEPEDVRAWWWRPGQPGTDSGTLAEALLKAHHSTVRVLLSVTDVLLTEVELNRKQARHLQRVLPWLLEEQLLDAPERLWFASGKASAGRYPVVACDHNALKHLLACCQVAGVRVAGVNVDAQLLAGLAPARIEYDGQALLLPTPSQALLVPADQQAATGELLGIGDLPHHPLSRTKLLEHMAATIASGAAIELLQADMRPSESARSGLLSRDWRQSVLLAAACVGVVALLSLLQTWRYDQLADQHRVAAEARYNELFPGDRALYLESQFRERLNRLGSGGSAGFLTLMMPVGESLSGQHGGGLSARRIHYDERENALTLDVQASDYDSLEALRGRISAAGLQAEIANYRSQGDSVTARLRVTSGV